MDKKIDETLTMGLIVIFYSLLTEEIHKNKYF